jgi:hypothetical protein
MRGKPRLLIQRAEILTDGFLGPPLCLRTGGGSPLRAAPPSSRTYRAWKRAAWLADTTAQAARLPRPVSCQKRLSRSDECRSACASKRASALGRLIALILIVWYFFFYCKFRTYQLHPAMTKDSTSEIAPDERRKINERTSQEHGNDKEDPCFFVASSYRSNRTTS